MKNGISERATRLAAIALIVGAVLVSAACEKMPLLAPQNSTVTVTAASKTLATGGQTEVTAFVAESSGTPVQNDTVVRFTTNLGRVDPAEVGTKNGYAVVTFYAGDIAGVADVRATSGSAGTASGATTATNVVQITVGAAAVENVVLRANPASVPPEGGTVELVAVVTGANNRALPGIPVSFVSTEGQLSSGRAVTDGDGEARVTIYTTKTASVTATAGTKTSTAVTITRRDPPPTPPTMGVTITVGTPDAATAQGQRWPFTAEVTASGGGTGAEVPQATKYSWDFGDGVTAETSGRTIAHVYATSAQRVVRTVTVRVSLSNGQSVSATTEILVGSFP